jgi:hypothetical protein
MKIAIFSVDDFERGLRGEHAVSPPTDLLIAAARGHRSDGGTLSSGLWTFVVWLRSLAG